MSESLLRRPDDAGSRRTRPLTTFAGLILVALAGGRSMAAESGPVSQPAVSTAQTQGDADVPGNTAQNEAVKAADTSIDAGKLALLKVFMSEFVEITPGKGRYRETFTFGINEQDGGHASEGPAQDISLEKHAFWIAKYEVPQNLYLAVAGTNPSRWKGPRNSAEMMSYAEAAEFCRTITTLLHQAKLLPDDEEVRLPTEAEWEYCCRAGTKTRYSFGDEARKADDEGKLASLLDPYCWHTGNAAGNDPPVGALKPNAWDLYDMHGYLWEFVQKPRRDTEEPARLLDPQTDTSKPADDLHIIRGGGWTSTYDLCTSTSRLAVSSEVKRPDLGFRCVRARLMR